MSVLIYVASGQGEYTVHIIQYQITVLVCITNLQTFILNLTFDVWIRYDNSYLDVTIQEVAKFRNSMKSLFKKNDSRIF